MNPTEDKIQQAVRIADECAHFDGSHHKMWVIDQMVRTLLGEKYSEFVADRPDWDEGCPP